MAVVPFPTPTKEPTNITLVNAQVTISYTSNAWIVPPWTLVDGSFPSLVLNVTQNAYVPYDNFTNFPAPTKVPTDITIANAKSVTSYTSNTWVAPPWTFTASQYPSMVLSVSQNAYVPYDNFLNFPTPTQQPSDITDPQSRTSVHYGTNTWDVVDVWWVQEGERPRFISEKVTYDYVIQIRSQTESVFIALFTDNVSRIKVKMPDGVVASVGLVEVNATDASVIRVMTSAGLMAFQKVEV